jgi:hypothetical protein
MRPIILGSDPEALWPLLHEVSGVSRQDFRKYFMYRGPDQFISPRVGEIIVEIKVGSPLLPLVRQTETGVTRITVPHPGGWNSWYNEPAHRLAVGLLLEELLCL